MLSKHSTEGRHQVTLAALDELVPQDHLVRKIDQVMDFDFIYDVVKHTYSLDNGRLSVDPVVLVKMVLLQYLFGIRSMRQTIKEIETNVAYRWFLGYDFSEKIPHSQPSVRTTHGVSMIVICLNRSSIAFSVKQRIMVWLILRSRSLIPRM